MNQPLQVGITGGIGSGKSLVCRIFRSLGAEIYDADSRAKSLMSSDKVLIQQIKGEFGSQSYNEDGRLDRSYLGKITFVNPEKLAKLNSFVHPRVADDYRQWIKNQKGPYVIREAALLYEAGLNKSVDKMIVVSSPEALRIKRILTRDPKRTESDIRAIMKNQWPEEEKIKRADYVIYNDEDHLVIPQVIQLHKEFTSAGKE